MLILIILGILFLFFLAQAICETIWGLCLVIVGLLMEGLAYVLDGISFVLRFFDKPNNKNVGKLLPSGLLLCQRKIGN